MSSNQTRGLDVIGSQALDVMGAQKGHSKRLKEPCASLARTLGIGAYERINNINDCKAPLVAAQNGGAYTRIRLSVLFVLSLSWRLSVSTRIQFNHGYIDSYQVWL